VREELTFPMSEIKRSSGMEVENVSRLGSSVDSREALGVQDGGDSRRALLERNRYKSLHSHGHQGCVQVYERYYEVLGLS
jgi:hypothetical protein